MLEIKYYLHVWSASDTDEKTRVIDNTVHPLILDDIGLEFDEWHKDDIYYTFPIFIVTERLKCLIDNEFKNSHKIKFTEIVRSD